MPHFPYGPVEIAHLKDRDPVLGAVIDRIGRIEREMQPNLAISAHPLEKVK